METSPKPNNQQGKSPAVTTETDPDSVTLETAASQPKKLVIGAFYSNTQTSVIQITEDKIELALNRFARRLSLDGLIAPLGIELSLIAVLGTADFKTDHLGVSAGVWQGIFIGATILVAIWLFVALIARYVRGSRDNAVKACVKEMRGTAGSVTLPEQLAPKPPKKLS